MPESFNRFSTDFSSDWICIGVSLGRKEMLSGTEELQLEGGPLSYDRLGFTLRFQSLLQNALYAVNVL